MNFVILSGRLTRDPEIRYTNNNKAVLTFTLAVDSGKNNDGDRITQFLPCVVWEHKAETIDQYFNKGDGIIVKGSLQSRTYERDGQKHNVVEVVVKEFEFPLSRKSD